MGSSDANKRDNYGLKRDNLPWSTNKTKFITRQLDDRTNLDLTYLQACSRLSATSVQLVWSIDVSMQ